MASDQEIGERVRNIIAQVFHLSSQEIQGELSMGNPAGWDSLGHMNLVMELEKEFGFTFPTFVIADLVSIRAIVQAVRERTSA